MTTLSYPFKDHPEPWNLSEVESEIFEEFYKWTQEQPNLRTFSKNHVHLFLHSCYWKLETAKKVIQRFVELRNSAPIVFQNRDPLSPEIQNALNIIQTVSLPNKTKEGYKIIVYRLSDFDSSKFVHQNVFKALMMFVDYTVSRDLLTNGYMIILDMKGLRISHFPRLQLSIMRLSSAYFQEAHPFRLKKILFINSSTLVSQLMVLARPFINPNLMSIMKFTTGGPDEFVDRDLLPEDFGGPLPPLFKLYSDVRNTLETEYREWIMSYTSENSDSKKLKANQKIEFD